MINIAGIDTSKDSFLSEHPLDGAGLQAFDIMYSSENTYRFASPEELLFELAMRRSIITASEDLYRRRLRFSTFRKSECNEDFWDRMDDGGFRLKSGIRPSQGIYDIFRHTRRYATECATAIVMLYYKAVLDIYGEDIFDFVFPDIVLMDWTHLDNPTDILTYKDPPDYLPGDCRYFKNPDVDPLTPEWQGENAIEMGDGTYYGHGIGIRNEKFIIEVLNRNRIDGSETSAFLTDTVTKPSFKLLFKYMHDAETLE